MKIITKYLVLVGCAVVIFFGCGKKEATSKGEPLATVFGKSLYASDIDGIVGSGISAKDSTTIVQSYIESWAKEQLIIAIAEQNIPDDLDVNKLVEDYRKSLIRYTYEQKLVEQRLDSVVSDVEIEQYYKSALDQYQLDKTIIQGSFIKVIKEAPQQDSLKIWWQRKRKGEKQKIAEYSRMYADKFLLEDSTWVSVDYLAAEFPISSLREGNLTAGMVTTASDESYNYYIRVTKVVRQGQIAPLSYIKEKIIKVILRKRKFELLDNMIDELYKRELNKKSVVIYSE